MWWTEVAEEVVGVVAKLREGAKVNAALAWLARVQLSLDVSKRHIDSLGVSHGQLTTPYEAYNNRCSSHLIGLGLRRICAPHRRRMKQVEFPCI